jgi:hypothetical protein
MAQVSALLAGLVAVGVREVFVTVRHVSAVRAAERVALQTRGACAVRWSCTVRGAEVVVARPER